MIRMGLLGFALALLFAVPASAATVVTQSGTYTCDGTSTTYTGLLYGTVTSQSVFDGNPFPHDPPVYPDCTGYNVFIAFTANVTPDTWSATSSAPNSTARS